MNLRNLSRSVKKQDVTRGEILKKIIFESQRQMARTLMDKTMREEHVLSKKAETRLIVEEASRKAKIALRSEDLKLKAATIMNPVPKLTKKLNSMSLRTNEMTVLPMTEEVKSETVEVSMIESYMINTQESCEAGKKRWE